MKTEIFVNPIFSYLTDFIEQTPEKFDCLGSEMHTGRNEVRLVDFDGLLLVVKYFKRITTVNRIFYATIRKSKAQRAYEHSKLLLNRGVTSPEPVAYINIYRYGILYQSYYVSLYTNYRPLRELLELPISESEEGLKAFARFTYQLHSAGILHDDYTIDNVLYQYDYKEYDFSLIDNNRMRFRRYSFARGIWNLERLKIPVERMGIIAAEYAREAKTSDIKTLNAMVFIRLLYLLKISHKKGIKALLRLLSRKHQGSPITLQQKDIPVDLVVR